MDVGSAIPLRERDAVQAPDSPSCFSLLLPARPSRAVQKSREQEDALSTVAIEEMNFRPYRR
jgi:hypothetical protein